MLDKKIKFALIIPAVILISNFRFVYAEKSNPEKLLIPEKITLKIKETSYELSKSEIENWKKQSEDLTYAYGYRSEIENADFCRYKKSLNCKLQLTTTRSGNFKHKTHYSISQENIAKFLDDLARKTDKEPVNAKIQFENGKVSAFSLSSNGVKINKDDSIAILTEAIESGSLPNPIELAYKETKPEISTDDIDNLGITSLIGEGKSDFKGSPKNRVFNIKVATNRFNGVIIKPGEEFSFVKILGEVDGEHGYLPELVIKKDKTEPEFGGGICQVSTTAFRAAIYSGLKISARKNHAYPVQYYNPQGMDATVYVPRPDLRFINNTPGHILIQTKIEGTELVFQFYGTNDSRKVNVTDPKILERNTDGSMKTTFSQQVYDKSGKLIIEDVFNSSYDSPDKYPHVTVEKLTSKPENWSQKQWSEYKKSLNP